MRGLTAGEAHLLSLPFGTTIAPADVDEDAVEGLCRYGRAQLIRGNGCRGLKFTTAGRDAIRIHESLLAMGEVLK